MELPLSNPDENLDPWIIIYPRGERESAKRAILEGKTDAALWIGLRMTSRWKITPLESTPTSGSHLPSGNLWGRIEKELP